MNNNPSRIRGAFSINPKIPNDRSFLFNNPPNPYTVNFLSGYTQDEISVSPRFKLTPGLRLDYSFVGEQAKPDPALNATTDYSSSNPTFAHTAFKDINNKWLGKAILSPRLGFNFDVNGNQKLVFRGGTGVFVGRMPFAWFGYACTLNGDVYPGTDKYTPLRSNGLI